MDADAGIHLLNDAGFMYSERRKGVRAGLRGKTRAIGRAWSWGDKKKAAQTAAGVALGVVGVTITASTFGAATPAGVVLAVGGFALASGGSFASSRYNLKHRPKNERRIEKLIDKLDNMAAPRSTDDYVSTKNDLKYWRNNAHKSARRCLAHWRKAIAAGNVVAGQGHGDMDRHPWGGSCDDTASDLADFMKFVHHLDKTRLYLLPTIIIAEAFGEVYRSLYEWTNQVNAARFHHWLTISESVKTCDTKICYHRQRVTRLYPGKFGKRVTLRFGARTAENIALMQADRRRILEGEGVEGGGENLGAFWQRDAYRGGLMRFTEETPNANKLAQQMLEDVARVFDQPAVTERFKRNVKGWSQRRTKGEIAAFAVQNLLGAVGAGVGGSGASSLAQNITTVVELGKQLALDIGLEAANIVLDHVAGLPADAGADVQNVEEEIEGQQTQSHHHFAKVGRQQQGRVEKIAVHLAEALKSATIFEETKQISSCEQALELAVRYHKVMHHLEKVEKYGIEELTGLAHAFAESTNAMMTVQARSWGRYENLALHAVQRPRDWHEGCRECCYTPHGNNPNVPTHAIGGLDQRLVDRDFGIPEAT